MSNKHHFFHMQRVNLLSLTPAVEAVQERNRDVDAVELDEMEKGGSEFFDFVGVYMFAVSGEVIEKRFGKNWVHVTAC